MTLIFVVVASKSRTKRRKPHPLRQSPASSQHLPLEDNSSQASFSSEEDESLALSWASGDVDHTTHSETLASGDTEVESNTTATACVTEAIPQLEKDKGPVGKTFLGDSVRDFKEYAETTIPEAEFAMLAEMAQHDTSATGKCSPPQATPTTHSPPPDHESPCLVSPPTTHSTSPSPIPTSRSPIPASVPSPSSMSLSPVSMSQSPVPTPQSPVLVCTLPTSVSPIHVSSSSPSPVLIPSISQSPTGVPVSPPPTMNSSPSPNSSSHGLQSLPPSSSIRLSLSVPVVVHTPPDSSDFKEHNNPVSHEREKVGVASEVRCDEVHGIESERVDDSDLESNSDSTLKQIHAMELSDVTNLFETSYDVDDLSSTNDHFEDQVTSNYEAMPIDTERGGRTEGEESGWSEVSSSAGDLLPSLEKSHCISISILRQGKDSLSDLSSQYDKISELSSQFDKVSNLSNQFDKVSEEEESSRPESEARERSDVSSFLSGVDLSLIEEAEPGGDNLCPLDDYYEDEVGCCMTW